jgi:RNA 2',3'-cyclic 3'-phosphodiesterase
MHRLFFALQPSAAIAARTMEVAAPWFGELQVAPVPAGNLHATLCFMGAVAPERLGQLREVASHIRARPVELEFDEFNFWDTPRVLCACASRESAEATALSIALHEATIAAGFSPDAKIFRAHLTLARKIRPALAEKITWPQKISPGFVVRCEEFVLMESHRDEQGSIYSVVNSWPLYENAMS